MGEHDWSRTDLLVSVNGHKGVQSRDAAQQGTATAGHDALLHRRTSGIQGVRHTVLLLIDLHITSSTNLGFQTFLSTVNNTLFYVKQRQWPMPHKMYNERCSN